MNKAAPATHICQICKKPKSPHDGMMAELIRPSLLEFIKKRMPGWDGNGFVCLDDLGEFRKNYVKEVLQDEIGELSALDQEVIESLQQHEILSSDISKQFETKLTFGERLSDRIASFGGSWRFIILFGAVLFGWIILNGIFLLNRGFDPYPFILLNLILDRKSTRLNSSHGYISYAVFCLKNKTIERREHPQSGTTVPLARTPCIGSAIPHTTTTRVPNGRPASAGIGRPLPFQSTDPATST